MALDRSVVDVSVKTLIEMVRQDARNDVETLVRKDPRPEKVKAYVTTTVTADLCRLAGYSVVGDLIMINTIFEIDGTVEPRTFVPLYFEVYEVGFDEPQRYAGAFAARQNVLPWTPTTAEGPTEPQ